MNSGTESRIMCRPSALLIFDGHSDHANGVGIINGAGRLSFNAMPPLGDSTTNPIEWLGISSSQATFSVPLVANSGLSFGGVVGANNSDTVG